MSGGSYNYRYYTIEEEYVGRMYDAELDAMMEDLCNLLHDLEWWQSGDYGEERYRETVKAFKEKWFNEDRKERLEQIIEEKCSKLKEELMNCI